jgi:membrane fusion protein, multidrug efflux system
MSDRLTVALALVPMFAGVALVAVLQRPIARSVAVEDAAPTRRSYESDRADALSPSFPGVVVAARSAEVAAESDGRIARVLVRSGTSLRQGDPILQIDRTDVNSGIEGAAAEHAQRRSEQARAEARRARASDALARMQSGGAWLSAQELSTARSELLVADAELAAASSATAMSKVRLRQVNLRAARHVITAPFDGVLLSSDLDVGDSVVAGQILARVVSHERRVRFGLPREYLPQLATSRVELRLADGAKTYEATVVDVRPEVDPAAQLVFAQALPTAAELGADWVLGAHVRVRPAITLDPLRSER